MEKENSSKKFIKRFLISILAVAVLIAGTVIFFDPFYHYHKPWCGLKAVLNDKEYQCVGTLRNFDYNALLVGSSVMENNNNAWYDDAYGVKSIKAIRSYGATADLCYLLDVAYEKHDLEYVFYNIDPSSLVADAQTTFEAAGCPMYLYDKNPINDVNYLFNKDVLFEKIPYQVANSFIGDYDEGLSYNWAKWKTFGEDQTLSIYFRKKDIIPMLDKDVHKDKVQENIKLLTKEVREHPDTKFIFFYPAYSMLWWDGAVRTGERDAFIQSEIMMTEELLKYDNARVFCFQGEEEIVTDLNNYMDSIHFSQDINKYMIEKIIQGQNELTLSNYKEKLNEVKTMSDKIVKEKMPAYEKDDRFVYEMTE